MSVTCIPPYFYIAKLGYAGVYLFFLHRLWVLVRTSSLSKNEKNIKNFLLKIFIFIFYKLRKICILHGHVFIMNPLQKKAQVGKDQEKAQSEKDSHSKNRGGKKPN